MTTGKYLDKDTDSVVTPMISIYSTEEQNTPSAVKLSNKVAEIDLMF